MSVPFSCEGEGWQALGSVCTFLMCGGGVAGFSLESVCTFRMCGGGVAGFRKCMYLSHVWGRGGRL